MDPKLPLIFCQSKPVLKQVLLGVCMVCAGLLVTSRANAQSSATTPLTIDTTVTADAIANVSGGIRHKAKTLVKAQITADYDGTGTKTPWLIAKLDVGAINGEGFSSDVVGDTQGVSNIEAFRAFRIFNAWIGAASARVGIKAGIIDANADFDEQIVGQPFLNSSHGVGAEFSHSGLTGPSIYPNSALGAVAWAYDADLDTKLSIGLFNGRANDPANPSRTVIRFDEAAGVLMIAELSKTTSVWRLAGGAWHYTSALENLRTGQSGRGSSGAFVTFEPTLVRRDGGLEAKAWVRAGIASRDYNSIDRYLGGGVYVAHPFSATIDDSIGIAIARAHLNSYLGSTIANETTFEAFYQRKVTDWLTIQPDVQYVVHPSGEERSAIVLGARIIVTRSVKN